MSAIRGAAAAAQVIGALWAVLALIYATDRAALTEFAVGVLVVAAGAVVHRLACRIEDRRAGL